MPADEQIRVTFLRIILHESSRRRTSGRFRFTARVGAQRFGQTEGQIAQVDTRDGTMQINLESLNWTCDVRVAGLQRLEIRVDGQKLRRIRNRHLGTTRHRFTQVLTIPGTNILHVPQGNYEDSCRHYTVRYRVEPGVRGRFQMQLPNTVFATRAHRGAVTYTTVAGVVRLSRIEISPVIPVPTTGLPPRPAFPTTAQAGRNLGTAPVLTSTSPINSIKNPACIPILSSTEATQNNTAHLTVTYYRPWTLFFRANDPRLEWSAAPANRVRFLNNDNKGLSVKVYGTGTSTSADIDVTFTLKFEGEACAKFRAVLGPVKTIPCRFNIFNGPPGPADDPMRHRPRVTPTDISHQMIFANIFLRQTGIQLQLDSNTTQNTTRPGGGPPLSITAAATAGIYTITVPSAQTRNAPWNSIWLQANYRANVMNFCFLKSSTLANARGFAFKWPEHPNSTAAGSRWDFTENGTPSTSWIQPSGNPPDTAAQAVTMKVIAGYKCNNALPAALNGMAVIERNNDLSTLAGRRSYGGTIAHEVGHMLSLGHRIENPSIAGGSYDDELTFPPRQNVMLYYSSDTRGDYDIAQTKVMRSSALIP